jgi:surface protein
MARMFRGCANLEDVPELDTSNVTDMSAMFYGLNNTGNIPMHIKSVPDFDYSKVTNFGSFLKNNVDLTEIPEMNIEANVTRCDGMFINCPNVKSGQKALYDKLSAIGTITNHTDCFKDCGSDTDEGRAELAQIPESWGGTKEV